MSSSIIWYSIAAVSYDDDDDEDDCSDGTACARVKKCKVYSIKYKVSSGTACALLGRREGCAARMRSGRGAWCLSVLGVR